MRAIENGDRVQAHYTGRFEDGEVFDSSTGREPLEFIAGAGQLIPGFDQAVVGMTPGESKTVTVPPEMGYGEHSDDRVVEVPRSDLPDGREVKPGDVLQIEVEGHRFPAPVAAVAEDRVIVDLNAPLAGKTLVFDIEIVAVEPGAAS